MPAAWQVASSPRIARRMRPKCDRASAISSTVMATSGNATLLMLPPSLLAVSPTNSSRKSWWRHRLRRTGGVDRCGAGLVSTLMAAPGSRG
jgi:hypothetical protein